MKSLGAVLVIVVVAWLGFWISNMGILIYSADMVIPKTRDCRYFIGVTVIKRIVPLAERCPLLRTVGL